jgi:AbrB family looped-hinge helix DNA binding protein
MSEKDTIQVGRRGAIVIPARLRRRYAIQEGTLLIAEEASEGILLRRAIALPVEVYTPERIAEFLLNNAVDAEDYESAREEVRKLGLDPDTIPQIKPPSAD